MVIMKVSLVVLVGILAIVSAISEDEKSFLERQKALLLLFHHIHQESRVPEIIEIANNFNINDYVDKYEKPEVVKNFIQYYKYDFLHRGEIFSINNNKHLKQAIALFKLFYYAKDWDTFYKTAAWARQNVNEGVFVYAVTVFVVYHKTEHRYVLPPIYEIFPHYFFSSEVIEKAQQIKQTHQNVDHKVDTYIDANYSGWYLNLDEEQTLLSYYLEDIDVNARYYYYHIYYPSWMSSEEYGWDKDAKRGELFYAYHQQTLARYYLERLANGLGQIKYINSDVDIETPYQPSLVYPNGLAFPSRPAFVKIHPYYANYGQKWTHNLYGYSQKFIKDFSRRIYDAIDSGYVLTEKGEFVELYTEDGLNTLGNIIDANSDSLNPKYYGPLQQFVHHLYGYSHQSLDDHKLVPSVLEHYETSLRDPVFFQVMKKIITIFQRYLGNVKPYTEKEIVVPGIKITKFEVDDLITYYDYFYSDLVNALWFGEQEKYTNFKIRVRQPRLNHKQFTYKTHIKSDKPQKVSVKVFIAPKYDEYDRYINLTENRLNFVELSHTVHDVQEGENVITKHCQENFWYASDRASSSEIYNQLKKALEGNGEFKIDSRQQYFNYPQRFMLPKGSKSGFPVQFFVAVYPYNGKTHVSEVKPGSGKMYVDDYPILYPLNRMIRFEEMWRHVPNFYFHEAHVYHKDVHEVNAHHD